MPGPQIAENNQGQSVRQSPNTILIDHAIRCWQAECENAHRIASRRQIIAWAVIGLLGLGLFKVDWLCRPDDVSRLHWGWVAVAMRLLLALALGLFGLSLWAMFQQGRRSRGGTSKPRDTASQQLSFRKEDRGKPPTVVVFVRTYEAYADLQRRNAENWVALQRGERWFGYGLALVILATILYILLSIPPRLTSERSHAIEHGNNATTQFLPCDGGIGAKSP